MSYSPDMSMVFRVCSVVILLFGMPVSGSDHSKSRPIILLIVADDVGYSDIGVFGSEIATPNIDALAAEGVLLTQFHVSPNCGPTRGAMMTGVDPHRAGLGGNHGAVASNQDGLPGYEGYLRDDVVSIAQLLNDGGYHTYMTGKWHLGKDGNNPASRGFEKSFALMNGAASHWADQEPIIPGSRTRYSRNGNAVETLPSDFYSTKFYTDELISYIDSINDKAPFFAFLSYTAAHNPLHAPRKYIEKYRGRFDGGWDQLAVERLARLQTLGLVTESQEPQPRPDWVMAWAVEDGKLDQKIAELRNKYGRPPNIIHYMWDDQPVMSFGDPIYQKIRGYETPQLNKLAQEGMIFTRMLTEPGCTPSRSATMTGQLAIRTGTWEIGFPIEYTGFAAENVTLAEVLSKAGYATGFYGKLHLGDTEESYPHNQGYDEAFWALYNQVTSLYNNIGEGANAIIGMKEELLPENPYQRDRTFIQDEAYVFYLEGKIRRTGL